MKRDQDPKRAFGTLNTLDLKTTSPRGVRLPPAQGIVEFRRRFKLSEIPPPAERPPRQ